MFPVSEPVGLFFQSGWGGLQRRSRRRQGTQEMGPARGEGTALPACKTPLPAPAEGGDLRGALPGVQNEPPLTSLKSAGPGSYSAAAHTHLGGGRGGGVWVGVWLPDILPVSPEQAPPAPHLYLPIYEGDILDLSPRTP